MAEGTGVRSWGASAAHPPQPWLMGGPWAVLFGLKTASLQNLPHLNHSFISYYANE